MADNCSSFEAPWTFQPAFPDFSDAFSRTETETLTRALQMSLSTEVDVLASVVAAGGGGGPPFLVKPEPAASLSASDAETSAPKQGRSHPALSSSGGKIAKRKSRASKRSTTTYITADPANFRQMVQQVTGIRFAGPREAADAVLKPEPHRLGGAGGAGGGLRAPLQGSCLPTLDTSSFLLDRSAAWTPAPSPPSRGSSFGSPAPETAVFELDPPLPCYPTLESWGVM